MPDIPPVTGKQLIRLLKADGWEEREQRARHGVCLKKRFPDRTRITIVPDKQEPIPDGTLGAILGLKQTGLTKAGLRRLIRQHKL